MLLANLDTLISYHKERAAEPEHQDSLFASMTDTSSIPTLRLVSAPKAFPKDILLWEKDLLGLYISGHPLDAYKEKFQNKDTSIKSLESLKEEMPCVIGGLITEIREVMTKKGDRMTFIRVEDFSGSIDVVVFPKVYEEFKSFIIPDNCIAIKGKVSKRNGETSMIADKIKSL